MRLARVVVLASGGGSNLQAILDHESSLGKYRAVDVVAVATDRADAGALRRAAAADIDGVVTQSRLAPDAEPLAVVLERYAPDHVVLAGYLQLIPSPVTRRYHGRMVNVHPGPLPAFGGPGMYGARVHRGVLDAGVSMSGPTVHFVDDQYDHGAVIAHWPVPVHTDDDADALAARVLRAEHLLFPRVVHALAAGEVGLSPDGAVVPPFLHAVLPPFDPSLDTRQLGDIIDAARR